jgi:phosphoglucosamine mutase
MPKFFGSSGVRGLVNVEITPSFASRIGAAIATQSQAKRALVARDTRTSGLMLENALTSGLTAGGVDVIHMGIIPTPVLAFMTRKMNANVGVMITASHNPPQYNGIKIFNSNGMSYTEKDQKEIEETLARKRFSLAYWQDIGETKRSEDSHVYLKEIERAVKLHRKWNIVVDPGCGAAFDVAPRLLKNLGCRVIPLNAQPDGFFPARSPEPNEHSLKSLAATVETIGADLGIAYDGDGDRVAFIDEKGRIVDFDRALAAYAAYVAKKNDGGLVVTNVEASMCIEKMVQQHGAKVMRTKVGDVYLSEAMKKNSAIFGGEPCGAWIHPQFHYCPDGILSSVLLLKALEDENKKLTEMIAETPKYQTLRRNVACPNETKYEIVRSFSEDFVNAFPHANTVTKVDGIRIPFEDGWVLIRASGTEPLIRLTVEGESLKTAKNIMKKSLGLIEESLEK